MPLEMKFHPSFTSGECREVARCIRAAKPEPGTPLASALAQLERVLKNFENHKRGYEEDT